MHNNYNIRLITPADAEAVLKIYTTYVLHTANTFEYDVPVIEEFRNRIEKISTQYPYLVYEIDGQIAGYAYGSTHRERAAYRWCAEATVYVDEAFHRRGIARALYTTLFTLMKAQGYHSIYVSILCTNTPSVAFHKSIGFEEIGVFKNIGYKLGEWHSNNWMQLFLNNHTTDPKEPTTITEFKKTDDYKKILQAVNEKLNAVN